MNIPRPTALYVSLTLIVTYWVYQVITAGAHAVLPADFSAFAGRIALIKLIHISAIFLLLRLERVGWQEMGVSRSDWKRHLLRGLLYGLILFVLLNVGLNNVLSGLFPKPESQGTTVMMYLAEPRNLLVWILLGILGGGVVEELIRIFVLTRFERAFHAPGLYFALICSSVVFGFGHLYQGTGAAISTGISGLIMGLIFIRRRSALEVIAAHAFSDVLAILAAYALTGHN